MQFKDWIPLIGWIVVFSLGILSGGFIIPRLTTKRKIVDWAIVSENDIIPRELSRTLGLPVKIQVGEDRPDSLSTVKLRLGGGGNEVIENVSIVINFNKGSNIINIRPNEDLGEYGQYVKWANNNNSCRIEMKFLNPGKSLELDFLLSGYEYASANVDGAAPGLQIRRRDADRWILPTSILQSFSLNLMGLRYDPSIVSMNKIAEELRGLRQLLRDKT